MTYRGPFQPRTFCDSAILINPLTWSILNSLRNRRHFCRNLIAKQRAVNPDDYQTTGTTPRKTQLERQFIPSQKIS